MTETECTGSFTKGADGKLEMHVIMYLNIEHKYYKQVYALLCRLVRSKRYAGLFKFTMGL